MVCTNMWNFRLKFELCDSLYCSAPLARAFCRCCCLTTELLAHSQHCYTLLPQYTQFKSDVITDKSHREIFFVKVMCWIIWETWAKISKISWKHRVTKNSEWLCLILLSFRVSDFLHISYVQHNYLDYRTIGLLLCFMFSTNTLRHLLEQEPLYCWTIALFDILNLLNV